MLKNGAVAQLGERLNGIQEADGSIPFSSTNMKFILTQRSGFLFLSAPHLFQ